MRMVDILQKKRHGEELTPEEITFFVTAYTAGNIPDYQASALAMAICLNGMTDGETVALTEAMAASGDQLDLSRFGDLSVDKHSTGGVGDKTSLIVAPILAALGAKVTKMSGRGLGHTGGTVDKLESIPGYQTSLSQEDFLDQVERVGMAIIGQTGNLAPADKKLYALRDVTATVDSIPLITSSIMSKKLAAGSCAIVLDVKVGSGAFMKTPADARALAQSMVTIGRGCGRQMAALLTNMDRPLGLAIGNSLEIIEAVGVLKGEITGDLRDICVALASTMAELALQITPEEAVTRVEDALQSGAAFDKMTEWVSAQGGDAAYLKDTALFPKASHTRVVSALHTGYITAMDAEQIGHAGVLLGAGRATKEDTIDFAAGITLAAKVGDWVSAGDPLCTLHTNDLSTLDAAEAAYLAAITIEGTQPELQPLIYDIIR